MKSRLVVSVIEVNGMYVSDLRYYLGETRISDCSFVGTKEIVNHMIQTYNADVVEYNVMVGGL